MRCFRAIQFLSAFLLLASVSTAQSIRLGRHGDSVAVPTFREVVYLELGGVSATFDAGKLRLYASMRDDEPWYWVSFEQSAGGAVEISYALRNAEIGSESKEFASFASAMESEEWGEIVCDLFDAIGQEQVCCSRRFIRLRDGLEQPELDPEMAGAFQHYFSLLDDPDWRVRDAAMVRLADLGDDAILWLSRLNRAEMSVETAMRVDAILSRYPF